MRSCDINCDIGEGFAFDNELYPLISSANIACGYHAGDETSMLEAVKLASKFNVAIGAHPSFPDRSGFGRTVMQLSSTDLYEVVRHQVLTLRAIAEGCGAGLSHVKPHGALYNLAMHDAATARILVDAIKDIDENLLFYALHGSCLQLEANKAGLSTVSEVFADRNLEDNGMLTPRREADAVLTDQDEVALRAVEMVLNGTVLSRNGKTLTVYAETICIHSDTDGCVKLIHGIREKLAQHDICILRPGKAQHS